jgi:hypothetical protein
MEAGHKSKRGAAALLRAGAVGFKAPEGGEPGGPDGPTRVRG